MPRADRPSITHLPPLVDPPATILDWLAARFPAVERPTWERRMERGLVTDAEGSPLAADAPYVAHLGVRYFREVEEEPVIAAPELVVFADDHLVVADKPSFLPVVPGGRFVREHLLGRLRRRGDVGDTGELAPVHRLDRATSGLVVFARRAAERGAYAGLFARRAVEKTYEALARVESARVGTQWRASSRIVRGAPFFRMAEDPDGPPNATTHVELAEVRVGVGRFVLRPVTGRKHQLRLHMASLGVPILGDRWYPELRPESDDDPADPLRLLARRLAFDDPITGAPRRFETTGDVWSLARF